MVQLHQACVPPQLLGWHGKNSAQGKILCVQYKAVQTKITDHELLSTAGMYTSGNEIYIFIDSFYSLISLCF